LAQCRTSPCRYFSFARRDTPEKSERNGLSRRTSGRLSANRTTRPPSFGFLLITDLLQFLVRQHPSLPLGPIPFGERRHIVFERRNALACSEGLLDAAG